MKDRSRQRDVGCEEAASTQAVANDKFEPRVRPYEAPILICYGDVRDITLGGTLGFGESGAANDFDVFVP